MYKIIKRDGKEVDFDLSKITGAIEKAFIAQEREYNSQMIDLLAMNAVADVEKKANSAAKPAKKSKLNLKQYFKEMLGEVKKLTWLSVGDLVKHTAMVFVVVLAMSAVIWLLDLGFSAGVKGLATLTGAGTASTSQTAE